MKLGLAVGYSGADMRLPIERIVLAEKLGYDSVWTAEAYGSDAITPLAYIAALHQDASASAPASCSSPAARRPCAPCRPRPSTRSPAATA